MSSNASNAFFTVPPSVNEPVLSYAPGSSERQAVQATYDELFSKPVDVPMYIGGKEVRTGNTARIICPHDHKHDLGHYHVGTENHVRQAIDAALVAKPKWEALSWEHRAAIFLKVRFLFLDVSELCCKHDHIT